MEYPFIYSISTVDHSAEQPGQRVDCLSLGDEGGYLGGHQLGGGDGGEGLHVAEGDPELLCLSLGDDGVPGDGGGHHGVGGQQGQGGQVGHPLLLAQTPETRGEGSGGGEVLGPGGHPRRVHQGGVGLPRPEEDLEHGRVYHGLRDVDRGALRHHLQQRQGEVGAMLQ